MEVKIKSFDIRKPRVTLEPQRFLTVTNIIEKRVITAGLAVSKFENVINCKTAIKEE